MENQANLDHLESSVKSTLKSAREVAAALGTLAAGFIRYGVTVAESAMHESARTLDQTGRALSKIADRLEAGG